MLFNTIANFITVEAFMKIPSHYLKVQEFIYVDENLAIIFILQPTFQNQNMMVVSVRDVCLGCRVRLVYFFLINFRVHIYRALQKYSVLGGFERQLSGCILEIEFSTTFTLRQNECCDLSSQNSKS